MKIYTTNYQNTFIEVAADCPAATGEIPPQKGDKKSVANLQFELVHKRPYQFTSDEVLFQVHAIRNDISEAELPEAREKFFSRGQACMRASALAKRYGWGVHSNAEGKIALYGRDTEVYQKLAADKTLKVVKAMRTGK